MFLAGVRSDSCGGVYTDSGGEYYMPLAVRSRHGLDAFRATHHGSCGGLLASSFDKELVVCMEQGLRGI